MQQLVPPSVPDVETSYLGLLLTNNTAAHDSVTLLKPGNFYIQKHEMIYEAITDLVIAGDPVDLITVSERLKGEGLLDKCGGVYYLSELASTAISVSTLDYYAKVLIEYAMRRNAIAVMRTTMKEMYDVGNDVFEMLDETQQRLFDIESGSVRQNSTTKMDDAIDDAVAYMRSVDGAKDGITGVGTGFTRLDAMTGGWQKGDLVIIAARPSMGKTALALAMARNAWMLHKKAIGVFSFEMGSRSLAQRVLTSEARIDATKARNGKLDADDWKKIEDAQKKIRGMEVFLDDSSDSSLGYVVSKVRKMVRDGAEAIIVDYIQLMNAQAGSREQEIALISRTLKKLATELDVPIIALSQLSRAVEKRDDKTPMLSDLRESGAIEQDADVVAFVYRAERYGIELDEMGNDTKGLGDVIVSKQRNGPLGVVKLAFIEEYARFENLTTYYDSAPPFMDGDYDNQEEIMF